MGFLFDVKSGKGSGSSGPAKAQMPFLRHLWSSAASMRQMLENRMGIGQTAQGSIYPGSGKHPDPMVNTNYGGVGGAPATGGAGPQQMTMPDRYAQGLFGTGMSNLQGA